MSNTPTPIYLTDRLKETLKINGIDPENYGPAYGGESVGLDLYNTDSDIYIEPYIIDGKTILIPSGLQINLTQGHVGLILERGSITKGPLIHVAGVIDPGFKKEIFIACRNISSLGFTIKANSKLPFQLIVTPCYHNFKHVSLNNFENLHLNSLRKEQELGSSD